MTSWKRMSLSGASNMIITGTHIFFKKTIFFVLLLHYITNLMGSKLCLSKSASDQTVFISNNYLMIRAM